MLGGVINAQHGMQPEVVGLKVTSPVTPAATDGPAILAKIIAEIRHTDFVLLTFVIVALLLLLLAMIALMRLLAPRSYVYLEVKSRDRAVMFSIWTFPDASRYYSIAIPAPGLQLQLKDYGLFGALSLTARSDWFIRNTLTNQRIDLPKYAWLGRWSTRLLKQILTADNVIITPIVVHNHEFDFGHAGNSETRTHLQTEDPMQGMEVV